MPEFKVGDRVRVKNACCVFAGEIGTVGEWLHGDWLTVWLNGRCFAPAAFTLDELEPLPAPETQP